MTHTQLKSFLAIARYRSFTAAADQLYISQSALSQQMKSLEQELGFTLFDRGSRQLALTEAGRSFYQSALKMQEVYFHAVSEGQQLQRLHQQQLERLCIGCLGGQYFQIWMELLHTALPLLNHYAPPALSVTKAKMHFTQLCCAEKHRSPPSWKTPILPVLGCSFCLLHRYPNSACRRSIPWMQRPHRCCKKVLYASRICRNYGLRSIIIPAAFYMKTNCAVTCGFALPSTIILIRSISLPAIAAPLSCCCPLSSTAAMLLLCHWTGGAVPDWALSWLRRQTPRYGPMRSTSKST